MNISLYTRLKQLVLCCIVAAISATTAFSQTLARSQNSPNRGCATGTLPAQFEQWVQSITPVPGKGNPNQVLSVFNIPVIVHVIHNNEAVNSASATTGNNLSSQQIADQINILNKDFNGLNSDTNSIPNVFKSVKGKFQFNFCLAVVNPTGGVMAEPGIDRVNRVAKGWNAFPYSQNYMNSTIKPNSIWDPTRYLNMWVCPLSGGILGFATFPNPGTSSLGGLSPPYGSTTTDGLVMLNTAFGSIGTAGSGNYNLGRTATHEIGHWVGLRHIWGDGTCATDYCADTPPAQSANFSCPTHPHNVGGCNGNTTGEMTMNYMDYTDDACMYMFTNDQKNRAQLIMTHSPMRASLLTSTVCNLPTVTNDIGVLFVMSPTYSQAVSCSNYISPQVKLHNFGSNTVTSATYSYNVNGVNTQTASWTGTLLPGSSATVTLPQISNIPNGSHLFNVGFYSPNGNADPNLQNNYNNQYFSIINSFTLSATHSGSLCPSNTATLTAGGGATGYTWQPGGLTGTLVTVTPTASTIYTLTGRTGTCSNTRTLSLLVGPPSTFSIPSITVCAGTQTQVTPVGSSCSFTFFPSSLMLPFTPTVTQTYTVEGTCSNACPGTRSGTITVVPLPPVAAAVAPNGSLCPGGTATITASGASSYVWNTGSTNSQLVVSPLSNTIYTVTGTSGNCSKTATAMVAIGSGSLNISVVSFPPVACFGKPLVLQASGATTYTWNTGTFASSISVTPTSNTSYTVFGINGSCTASAVTGVNVVANPTITLTSSSLSNTVCAGGTVSLSASGAASYLWSNGSTSPMIALTPSSTAVHMVTGTSNGCSTSQTISITVAGTGLGLSISSSTNQVCSGGSVILTGSGVSTYTWTNGSTSASIIVNPISTTTYTLSGENGTCKGDATITVSVIPSSPLILAALPSNSLCAGQTATLFANGNFSGFNWSSSPANSASIIINPTTPSVYSVTGTNSGNGCVAGDTIAIFMVPSPVTILTNSNTICNDPCTGMINAITTGGVPPFSYILNTGACSTMPCNNLCQGFYSMKTIDSQGCTSINYFSIECTPGTSLEEGAGTAWSVFPNPAADHITIRTEGKRFTYGMYNQLGQMVRAGTADTPETIISTGELSAGIYILQVTTGRSELRKKIIIE